jgi:hypothetical protein
VGTIDLSWSAVPNTTGYVIEYANNSSFSPSLGTVSKVSTATAHSFTSLNLGITYYFRIKSTSPLGDSVWSGTVNARTPYSCLSVTCSGLPVSPTPGQNVTWTATPSGASAPYTYSWSNAVSGTSNPISTPYGTTGVKTANVTATSADGQTASNSCAVTVVASPPTGNVDLRVTSGSYVSSNGPISVVPGAGLVFSWTSGNLINGSACTNTFNANHGNTSVGEPSVSAPGSGSQNYSITCIGADSVNVSDNVVVNIIPPTNSVLSATASSACGVGTVNFVWNDVSGDNGYVCSTKICSSIL